MFLWSVGFIVVGCSILVLKVVIFVVFLKLSLGNGWVVGVMCGLVVYIFVILV